MKYEAVYLRAYASALKPGWDWKTTSGSTTDSDPIRRWATGSRPRFSMGSLMKGVLTGEWDRITVRRAGILT